MDKEFEDWYQNNLQRFHCGQFEEKDICYSAWLAGRDYECAVIKKIFLENIKEEKEEVK